MALGEFRLLQFKSREQMEKEEREYADWAFPNGDLQKENLAALMQELSPKTSTQLALVSFLTCKELFERTLKRFEAQESTQEYLKAHEAAVFRMLNDVKIYSQLIKPKEMPMYLALVLADEDIDESCEYPTADEMRESIKLLEEKRKDSIWKLLFKKMRKSTDKQ